ncbi:MAG: bifunctional phosphopantothenoylcysteine decarboxylase/phosphopantothenate--cysteine ligase CoaBC [Kiloniellales bacterium]|nr:bifunctional phosphopantothenoylcysteine decarboxylase/phosphopantothenate--cysteine ligase CoaBC [Kiloniellales bacterium]
MPQMKGNAATASGKTILLIISGGIAAYKSIELIRRGRETGLRIMPVLTKAGAQFVTPLTVSAISGEKVYQDLFSLTDETEMGHIELSRKADLVVAAPASADLLAKLAHGLADDLASTLLLATDKDVLVAPSMNVRMWEHPATVSNMRTLAERGILFVGPNEGDMACGEYGFGRMAEPQDVLDAIAAYFNVETSAPLRGRRALVTSGPTFEPLDPVRFIGNRSSGRQGHAVAEALAAAGAEVSLITGPTALQDPKGITTHHIETAEEMLAACRNTLPVDIAVFAAAVADWRPKRPAKQKIKKGNGGLGGLKMTENPDICATISHLNSGRPQLVIGFAAETENVLESARAKRQKKGCDWIVANDVSAGSGTFGGKDNQVHFIREGREDSWPKMTKGEVARRLAEEIVSAFRDGGLGQ